MLNAHIHESAFEQDELYNDGVIFLVENFAKLFLPKYSSHILANYGLLESTLSALTNAHLNLIQQTQH